MLWLFKKSVSLSNALRAVGSFLSSATKQCGILRPSSFRGSTSSFTAPAWSSARHARFLIKTWTHEFESDPDSQPWTVFESLFCHMKKHQAFYEVLHATGRGQRPADIVARENRIDARARERGSLPESVFRRRNQRMDRGMDRTRHARNTRRAERITETLC